MANGQPPGSSGQSDVAVRVATIVGVLVGAATALWWRPEFFEGFWLGLLGFVLFVAVGGFLGRLVGGLLFRPSSATPSEDRTKTP